VIEYEDSALPEIAIARPEFDVPLTMLWVRSRKDLMMLRDQDEHWMLVYFAANGSVQIESRAFWGITDVHQAADRMRQWLNRNGLIMPEDIES
jgi:hypothetical protein